MAVSRFYGPRYQDSQEAFYGFSKGSQNEIKRNDIFFMNLQAEWQNVK